MKLALLFSVVAFVAGQQYYPVGYNAAGYQSGANAGYPAPYGTQGPCGIFGRQRFGINARYQCCRPQQNGGCRQIRRSNYPQQGLPPFWWLRQVCCPTASTCCPTFMNAAPQNLNYQCCNSGETCSIDADRRGTCVTTGVNNPPVLQGEQIDGYGRCPDGAIPLNTGNGRVVKCTLNQYIPGFENQCPGNYKCILDYSGNANAGVCCPQTGCDEKANCTSCVSTMGSSFNQNGCQWLTQGDLYNPFGKCVTRCDHFPGRSCIIGRQTMERAQQLCPFNSDNLLGANFSTGSCKTKRCGLVGTGRSSRINNGTDPTIYQFVITPNSACGYAGGAYSNNKTLLNTPYAACMDLCETERTCGGFVSGMTGGVMTGTGVITGATDTCIMYHVGVTSPNLAAPILTATGVPVVGFNPFTDPTGVVNGCHAKNGTLFRPLKCCVDYPGDPCCDTYGQRAGFCAGGKVVGGPACGVPIRGTVNTMVAPPQPYYPPVRNGGRRRRQPFRSTWNVNRRRFYRSTEVSDGTDVIDEEVVDADAVEKNWFRRMPYYQRRPFNQNGGYQSIRRRRPVPYRRGRTPSPIPAPIDQLPSVSVCSCDRACRTKYYDCCQDYDEFCVPAGGFNSTVV